MHTDFEIGGRFQVTMAWQLGEALAVARFTAEVRAIDETLDRLFCRLLEITGLKTTHPPETVDQDMLAKIQELVGRYAYVPQEAASGVTLHLKVTTLTGEHPYFFDEPLDSGEGAGEL